MSSRPDMENPPVAGTTEGSCNAVGAIAAPSYASDRVGDKANPAAVAFRALTGRIWRCRAKRGRVLAMLATTPAGITQWDTLPWHTRLGGTIHALRRAGLNISTELEGDYRHARYRLHTVGTLIIEGENREPRPFMASENSQ